MSRRLGVIAAVAVLVSSACQTARVFTGAINIHPCSLLTTRDAEKLLGGPVESPVREYEVVGHKLQLDSCTYESRRDPEDSFDVDVDGEIRTALPDAPPKYGLRAVTGLGKQAAWLADGPHGISMDVLSSDGVLATYSVYIMRLTHAQIVERTKALARTLLPRISKALPGQDVAETPTRPRVDICSLPSADDRAVLGAGPSSRRWESFGGRHGGGWLCAWWVSFPNSYFNDVINVHLSREPPDAKHMRAEQGPAQTIPGLGQYAYWRGAETTPENFAGTLTVLSNRGDHFYVWVGLRDASREKPAALRIARTILSRL